MRMNYRIYPVDYVEELNRKGLAGAKKAMAFLSYWHCVEMGDYHSTRFHANKWGVSPSTGFEWMKQFDKEIDLFRAHWDIKKKASDSNIKKLDEQNERSPSSKLSNHVDVVSDVCGNTAEQIEQTKSSKVFNKYNNNRACDERLFLDLFNIYNINTQFPGSKDKALKQYEKMYNLVDHRSLIKSVIFYLHDPSRKGLLFNLENFLKNEVYANYIPTHIRVFTSGIWMEGVYDKDTEVFTPNNAEQMRLTSDVLTNKFSKGELEFIREVAA